MTIFGTQSEGSFAAEVASAAAAEEKAAPEASAAPEPAELSVTGSVTEEGKDGSEIQNQPAPTPPAAEPEPKDRKLVPIEAVHEERQKRQQLERDLSNLSEAFNRFQQMQQPQQEQQAFDPLEADPNQDPFTVIQALQQRVRQFEEGTRAQAEHEQLKTAYIGSIRQAVTADPTFNEAYHHLVQSRHNELTAGGMNPVAANETIKLEEVQLARTAFMNGRNPADVILGYAKARGWAPKAPEPPAPPPAEQVQQQAAKAAAATSISAGGKPPANDPSMADIVNLKGAAFDSAWEKFAANSGRKSSLFRS